MSYTLIDILSYSIVPSVCICLLRYQRIARAYKPFVWLVCLALLNETVSTVLIHYHISNAVNNNCFVLAEWWLFIVLFIRWHRYNRKKTMYVIIGCILTAVWVYENFYKSNIVQFNSVFRIFYSFALVFFAIDQVNALIVLERKDILLNARFLICVSIIIYFCYKAIVEIWYALHLHSSVQFEQALFLIPVFVNVLCNSIYIIASVCLPVKQKFSLPY